MTPSGVRAALRIARRTAARSKARSVLIVAMIGTPICGLAAADVLVRTAALPRVEVARRHLGAADLVTQRASDEPIVRASDGAVEASDRPRSRPLTANTATDLVALLPDGSRVVPYLRAELELAVPDGLTDANLVGLDIADPIARGIVRLRRGRVPRRADEIAVSPPLAELAGVRPGATMHVGGRRFLISGIAVLPDDLRGRYVVVPDPAAARAVVAAAPEREHGQFLVDVAAGHDPDVVATGLERHGWLTTTRRTLLHPERAGVVTVDERMVGAGVVVVGLAALEIVLLAGTAFAVGARRQRRELALVAAAGGGRGDVRRIVLSAGLVLGGVGGVVGTFGGVGLAVLSRPLLERLGSSELGPLDVRLWELSAIVALAVGTGLLSAAWPAREAARQDVVAALTGRRGAVRTPRRLTVSAPAAVGIGLVVAWYGAGARLPGHAAQPKRADFVVLLAGAVIAELGFVGLAPALVGAVARTAGRLPAALRLAVRDAARHRGRTGPAVGAVCAALAGSVALSVYVASDSEQRRREYRATLPHGHVQVHGRSGSLTDGQVRDIVAALPTRRAARVQEVSSYCDGSGECWTYRVEPPPEHRCPILAGMPTAADVRRWKDDRRCTEAPASWPVAGDADLVAVLAGRDVPEAAATLAQGGVVVFDPRLVDGRRARLVVSAPAESGRRPVELPALFVRPLPGPAPHPPVVAPAAVRRMGLSVGSSRLVVDTTRMPTGREERRARRMAGGGLYVERGFVDRSNLTLLALLGGSLLVTGLATGIAVGLAAADSRADLTTLAAIGAPPRVRRRLAGAQALTVSGIGSALGVLAGLVPAIAVLGARANQPIVVPVRVLAGALLVVPLLAALPAALCTRSRLPVERRIA